MEEIIKNKSFDKQIEEYYQILKKDMPELIDNVDIIDNIIIYLVQIYYSNKEIFENNDSYENKISYKDAILEVKKILNDINPVLLDKFIIFLNEKRLKYIKFYNIKINKSCTNGKTIYIKKRKNIEEIISIIHEFFHYIHIERYDYDMNNHEWYALTEMIAITFELYTVFKLMDDEKYKNDAKRYILNTMHSLYHKADIISIETMCLNMYDKYHKVDDESFKNYQDAKGTPNEFIPIINKFIKDNKKFKYSYEAPYIFGFPFAIKIANEMIKNNNYLDKTLITLININKYNFDEILDKFNIKDILNKENSYHNLYQIMISIDELIKTLGNKKEELKR